MQEENKNKASLRKHFDLVFNMLCNLSPLENIAKSFPTDTAIRKHKVKCKHE